MIRRPPRSTLSSSSAASDVYKRQILYNEYQSVAAFAVASLLALLALVTLVIKSVAEWRHEREMKAIGDLSPENTKAAPLDLSLKAAS